MRGQAHTLEAFAAALVVVGGVGFALQATAVTPLTASTSNQHIENQERAIASNLLATAAAEGDLQAAITDWNRSANRFVGAGERGYFTNSGPPNAFGATLNRTFNDRRIAFNVEVAYRTTDESRSTQRLVYMGNPSDNAVSATRTVTLTNDTRLHGDTGNVSAAAAAGEFYAPDAATGSELFNVMEVRIVVWRI